MWLELSYGQFLLKDYSLSAASCLYEPQTGSLNLADIRKWLASVTKELNYTYITVDSGKTMIRESTVFGADAKLATTGTKTKKIWTSNSPLKNACVKIFLSKFKSSKPTIYVSHISDMGSTAELQCMAKLVYNKIKVKSMDWESFANPLSKACKDLIMNTLNGASFKAAQNKLNEQIAEINNMSKSSNASQFCK